MASYMVLVADRDSYYSHVGIISIEDGDSLVVHVAPNEDEEISGLVQIEALGRFSRVSNASAIRVMRVSDPIVALRASSIAKTYYQEGITFDDDFSLDSDSSMYCTELVWKAYKQAGIDLIDGAFARVSIITEESDYILPSTLLRSNHLTEVLEVKK